jgi:hypothetical protein
MNGMHARTMYNELERNEERVIMTWTLSWKLLRMAEKVTADGTTFSLHQASPEYKSAWYK